MKNFVEELKWRGMLQDIMPETEVCLLEKPSVGYIGFDPTAPSLTVGNLVAIMLLRHFQDCGHKPIVVMGGATGMIGDPSGKADERKLLTYEVIQENLDSQRKQFLKFLDFDSKVNAAEIVNNYDWYKDTHVLDFLRDVGKHLTVNYMMAKDSVKTRLETGLSFTEFSYQLLQGYDFYYLYKEKGCTLQMGGSDQWGNITAGTELIRRMGGGEAFALTTPLLVKADGTKFGKSEQGNIWLDPKLTSPFQFYQFWINTADQEASKYLRYFSIKSRKEIEALEAEHNYAPHTRILQKTLAEELTTRVHSTQALTTALKATELLFGNSTGIESLNFLHTLPDYEILEIFSGVPNYSLDSTLIEEKSEGIPILEVLANLTDIFSSKGEAKKMIAGGGVMLNKIKPSGDDFTLTSSLLIQNRYLLVQKGKKNYFLVQFIHV